MSTIPCFRSNNGDEYPLNHEGNIRIGSQNADISLNGTGILPLHATIIRVRDRVMIKPENGAVFVNGQTIARSVTLQVGDVVAIGNVTLELGVHGGVVPKTTAPAASPLPPSLNRSTMPSFDLEEALFDEPIELPSTPIPPTPSAVTPASTPQVSAPSFPTNNTAPASDDHFLQSIQSGLASKPKSAINRPALPTPPTPQAPPQPRTPPSVSDPSNLTDDECRTVLKAFFNGSQIYNEKKGGGLELNFGQRWSKTSGTFGRSWVLATEGLKLGIKAMDWLANLENRQDRPADYVDAAIKRSVDKCVDVAYDRLMMQPTLVQYPLVIYGPVFWREAGVQLEHICARKGDDGFVRFSTQQVSILVLDDDQIGIFMCALDTIGGRIGSHKTRSYNYKDIVSVADEDTSVEVEMEEGTKKINVYAFNIEVSSGRNLSITLNSQTIRELFDGDALEQPEHQQTVNVIRQMWRTKKSL